MTSLVPLHFDNADIRMIILDGEPWWVLNDLCAMLGIANPRNAARRLRDWQKGVHTMDTLGGRQDLTLVNEAGVYKLALSSKKDSAEEFERWLTTQVLPSIRKYGAYPPPPVFEIEAMPEPEPLQAPHWSSIGARFLDEAERIAAEEGFDTDFLLSRLMSKPKVTMLRQHGEGVRALLKDEKTREAIIGLGFDMRYVQMGLRTLTREERDLQRQLRAFDSHQRAVIFARVSAQLPALAGPPADEIDDA